MLAVATEGAQRLDAGHLVEYLSTVESSPCLEFQQSSDFEKVSSEHIERGFSSRKGGAFMGNQLIIVTLCAP